MSVHEDDFDDDVASEFQDATDELPITFLIKFISKFDGNREELTSFLADCNRAFDLSSTKQKQVLLEYVITQISGKAKSACVNRTFSEWKDLKSYLRTMYADTKHKAQLLCELTTLKQTADETLSNFTYRMEACLKRTINSLNQDVSKTDPLIDPQILDGKLQMLQEIALNRFTYFTTPTISSALRLRDIKSLNEAITIAKSEEQIQKMVTNVKNPKPDKSNKTCNYCKKPGHMIGDCRKRQYNNSKKPIQSFDSKPVDPKSKSSNSLETCNYCKKKGHVLKDCYKKKYNDSKNAELKANTNSGSKNVKAIPAGLEEERWILIGILLTCSVRGETNTYKVEPIKPEANSGIFFEHLGSARLYADHFKLVTYMNISFYTRKLELIKVFEEKTKSLCKNHTAFQLDVISCQKTVSYLEVAIPSLEQKQFNLHSLLNHKRAKRGIFNGGGTLLKWILGVADSDDLDKIHETIDQVEKDDKGVLDLMQEQIHVIRTTIGNFNESVASLKIHEATFNSNIDKLNTYLANDGTYKQKNDVSVILLSYLNSITYLVNELNEQLDVVIDAILFTKSNAIHPKIISPTKFIEELNSRVRSLDNGKTFPLPLEPNYAFKLLEISRISCFYYKERLVFIIETPICDSLIFNLYRSLPLPVLHHESYLYIEPSFPYVLLSINKMQYKQVKDLKGCQKITEEDFLCESHTIYSTLENPSCESTLLTTISRKIPTSCKITKLHGIIYIWHELKFNQWLYVTSETDRLTIICKDRTYDEPVNGTGILTLNEKCTGYSKLNKLSPTYKLTTEYVNIIPSFPIILDDCCEEKANQSIPTLHLNPIHMSNIRLDELRHTTHQLNKFEQDLHNLRNQHYHHSERTNYFFLILKIIAGIMISVLIFKILQCIGCFALLSACCKCFDFDKSTKGSGCCVSIYNSCTNNTPETPIRIQPQLTSMRYSDIQRNNSESLYDLPMNVAAHPINDRRRSQARKSYHGYSLDD
ncbi:hypothetical protein HA402_013799 [Bradysia odoriphaga]|nr:hypothetical protein HA402_013799 [Bradysia odoriphaga]